MMNKKLSMDGLWKMTMAFQESKALFFASELDVFTLLSKKTGTAEDVAKKLHLHPKPVGRLLNAMVSFGLLKKQGEKFINTETAETFLVKGKPEYFGDYLSIVNDVYDGWVNYGDVIKENRSIQLFKKAEPTGKEKERVLDGSPPPLVQRIMMAQEQFSYRQAVCLPEAYDFSHHKLMLDVGGGTGIFSVMAVKANPHLKSIVFDVPQVCRVTRERIKYYRVKKKINVIEGNFILDELPQGADIALLSTILDGYDEPECRTVLNKVYESLKPKGVVIVNEMMLNENRTGPLFPALFSLELMAERNIGDSRTVGELKRWMRDAGFGSITSKPLKGPKDSYLNCRIVIGSKS
jgi:ubiquinone/menaquinone biosynthesis C-methylase UbiE